MLALATQKTIVSALSRKSLRIALLQVEGKRQFELSQ
jgi:hypothetical protein